jgi:hypothetical protein
MHVSVRSGIVCLERTGAEHSSWQLIIPTISAILHRGSIRILSSTPSSNMKFQQLIVKLDDAELLHLTNSHSNASIYKVQSPDTQELFVIKKVDGSGRRPHSVTKEIQIMMKLRGCGGDAYGVSLLWGSMLRGDNLSNGKRERKRSIVLS